RSLLGQAQGAPLIGPWTIGLAVVTLLVAIVAIFWPRIDGFYAEYDNAEYQAGGAVVRIKPGDSVRLWWSASPLVDLRIDPDPGKVDGPNGNALVKPDQATTRYTLTARNFLSFLVPNLYAQSGDVTVVLTQTQPSIVFVPQGPFLSQSDNTATLLRGQSVTLNWQVADADELVLQTNGVPESLVPGAGSRQVTPDRETTYVLVARNRFTGQDGVAAQVVLKVVDATPTPTATPSPIPAPEINRFDVLPQEIFVGDKVQLIWDVANVKQVTIRGLDGEWAPSGNVEAFPRENITYILTADNGSGQIQQMQRPVVVKPLPTGTPSPTPIPSVTPSPTPAAPKVDFFQAAPTEVTQGSSVRLSWSVSGDVTAIEIKAVGGTEQYFPTDKQGAQTTQPLSVFTQYVLTARNGTAASAPVQVNITIKPPPPAITVSAVVETTNQTLTDSNPAGDVFGYEPPVGQAVRLIWTNAAGPSTVKVSFNGQEFSPSGSTLITITRQSLISMPIVALSSNPPPLDRTAYTVEFRPVLAVPPAPTNLTLQTSIPVTDVTVTPPITLTWNYPPGNLVDITGFRLFRAPAGGSFQALSPDLPTSPLNWVDNGPGPLCGVSYYVVALYTDLVGLTQQTPTSSNSWQNPSCP
ncbi:MAG: hypothetical protein KA764_14955, partial [Anaerolineales bacterium]|nr:hypothetical protein [Anaerolineales bacterium]